MPAHALAAILQTCCILVVVSSKFKSSNQFPPNRSVADFLDALKDADPKIPALYKFDTANNKAAVCATGHLRTLILPGVHRRLKEMLLDPGKADLFLVGNLNDAGNFWRDKRWVDEAVRLGKLSAGSAEVKATLDFLKPKYSELHLSNCDELGKAWAADGINDRVCRNVGVGNFFQIMWLDHCIHKVRVDPIKYNLLVRTRPDVGIFRPVAWNAFPMDAVAWMPKDLGIGTDWFFGVPTSMLASWWDNHVASYVNGTDENPDSRLFLNPDIRRQVHFPVVLVRGPKSADCFRLVDEKSNATDKSVCEKTTWD